MIKVLIEIKDGEVQGVYSDRDIQFVIVNQDKDSPVSEIYFSDEIYLNLADVFQKNEDMGIHLKLQQMNF